MKPLIAIALPLLAVLGATRESPSPSLGAPSELGQPQQSSRGSPNFMWYDASRRELMLLTTPRDSGRMTLWSLTDNRWTRVPVAGPPARELNGAAYDTRRQRLVVFGGIAPNGGESRRDDTWEWDGRTWHEMPDRGAGPRSHHLMAFDERRNVTVMSGGGATSRSLANDTWEWDGSAWHRVATTGHGGRAHFAMVYDAARQRTVLVGGFDERFKYFNDAWAWDGKTWERIVDGGPVLRSHQTIAFDPGTGSIVMFGGLKNGRPSDALGDTWILTGNEWRTVQGSGPSARTGHVMAYDPVRRRIVLYGGGAWDGKTSQHFEDTWAWDGSGWTRIN